MHACRTHVAHRRHDDVEQSTVVLDDAALRLFALGVQNADSVFLIAKIDSDEKLTSDMCPFG